MVNVDVMGMLKLLSGEYAKELIEMFEIEVPKKRYDEDEEAFLNKVCKFCIQADLLAGICNIIKVSYIDIFNHSNSIKAMLGKEKKTKLQTIELPMKCSIYEAIAAARKLQKESREEADNLYHMKCHKEYSIRKEILEKALNEANAGDIIVLRGNNPYGDKEKMKVFEDEVGILNISQNGYLRGADSDNIAFRKGDLIDLAYVLNCWKPVYHKMATYKVVRKNK